MYSLQALIPGEPFEIEVIPGFFCTVDPIDAFDMELARAAAQKIVDDIASSMETLVVSGVIAEKLFEKYEPQNAEHRAALFQLMLKQSLAVNHIKSWRGIGDDDTGQEALPTPENIRRVMGDYRIADLFFAKAAAAQMEIHEAKKELASAANGKQAEAPDTARDAGSKIWLAPEGCPASTENVARSS